MYSLDPEYLLEAALTPTNVFWLTDCDFEYVMMNGFTIVLSCFYSWSLALTEAGIFVLHCPEITDQCEHYVTFLSRFC